MCARPTIAPLLFTWFIAAEAGAVSYDLTATTLLRLRQEGRNGEAYTTAPLYELLTLDSSRTDTTYVEDLRVVMSAWGNADVGDPRDGRHFDGDLDLAYVEGAVLEGGVQLRLGRQLIFGGAARNLQLDGLSVTGITQAGFGGTVYGGAPVTRRFEVDRGDAAAGARLFYRPSFSTEVGASAIHILDEGRVARQDVGLDARFVPIRELVLSGFGLMSAAEGRLAEASLQAGLYPMPDLDFVLQARRTAPDLFLPRNSIFTVFSVETRDELGGRARFGVIESVDVSLAYFLLSAKAGDGFRAEADVRYRTPLTRLTAGLEASRLVLPSAGDADGYWEGRAFCLHRLTDAWTMAADLDLYVFDLEDEYSLLGSGSVVYRLARDWEAVLSARGGTTPLYARYLEGIAKLSYAGSFGEAP